MDTGKRKTSLVVWSRLMQPKEIGGLGFKDYMICANTLLRTWVAKALDDTNTEWATIFITLLRKFAWDNQRA